MDKKVILAGAALACGLLPLCAAAQTGPAPVEQPVAVAAVTPAPAPVTAVAAACAGCITIPALTRVSVEVLAPLGSKTSKSGDTFPIRLAYPIVVDGQAILPAGATGMGEVVHAKKSGGSGAAGELVLAARYLEVDGRRLRLRSLQLTKTGKSRIDSAAMVAVTVSGIVGLLMTGGQTTVAEGTIADAKTAEAFTLPAAPAAAPAVVVQAPPAPLVQPIPQEEGKK